MQQQNPKEQELLTQDTSVNRWVETCLKTRNDQSIIQAMSGMHQIPAQRVADAVNQQFSDFIEIIGTRHIRVSLISIPISITSSAQLDERCFKVDEVTPYLQSFYNYGLIKQNNGGVIILNQMINHSIIENALLSDLYALSRAMFGCVKRGYFEMPNIPSITVDTDPKLGWIYVPDGYYSMRHLLVAVFWDDGQEPPPIMQGKGDIDGWQNALINRLLMGVFANIGYLEITALQPRRLFDSILNATISMVEKVVTTLAVESIEQAGDVEARLSVGADSGMPGRCQVKLDMYAAVDPEHLIASSAIRLSVMESMEIGAVLNHVQTTLVENGIAKAPVVYYTGPINDNVTQSILQ